MAWYNPFEKKASIAVEEKLNPAQPYIGNRIESSREFTQSYEAYYESLEIVNRAVNMIVDDTAAVNTVVKPVAFTGIAKGVKRTKVEKLLTQEPNLFQDINSFKRNLITDFMLNGNMFIYFDGAHLYHLPADRVTIHGDTQTYIEKYTYDDIDYSPSEVIHIKENSFRDTYRGVSRLRPATRTLQLMTRMRDFQDNFFKNGAVPGLVLKSPNTLSEKIKERMMISWQNRYRPDTGGRRPLILDGGLELDKISNVNFKDLDFQASIADNEKIVLKALGVPPILLDSGNNANIRPNMRLYYLETVLPIVIKLNSGLSRFFGFEIVEDVTNVPALQPELRDSAAYYTSLVNGGIISPNEAREALGYDTRDEANEIRVPANIAGSASNPAEGGRPPEDEEN